MSYIALHKKATQKHAIQGQWGHFLCWEVSCNGYSVLGCCDLYLISLITQMCNCWFCTEYHLQGQWPTCPLAWSGGQLKSLGSSPYSLTKISTACFQTERLYTNSHTLSHTSTHTHTHAHTHTHTNTHTDRQRHIHTCTQSQRLRKKTHSESDTHAHTLVLCTHTTRTRTHIHTHPWDFIL